MANRGLCNTCKELVPAERMERDGRIFLVKDCPDCGKTEALVASDADRANEKRKLSSEVKLRKCMVNCLQCRHQKPSLLFVDITNRCNLNCPICINNTPSMGFLFEPPLEYFEKIFKYFGEQEDPPAVQLFGGEPTVREDLFDIIRMAKSHGLSARVVTNGLKLASEKYCRRLIESRATILMAYDGPNPEIYRELRGNEKSLQLKHRALENLHRIGGAKAILMTLVAKGFNEGDVPDLLNYVHRHRDHIRAIYFMPIAYTWNKEDLDYEPEQTTGEDIEEIIDRAFPEDRIDFMVAGFHSELKTFLKLIKQKPWPFAGAHPNCESFYYLISDGERYRPLCHYLKGTVSDFVRDLMGLDRRLSHGARVLSNGTARTLGGRLRQGLFLAEAYLALFAMARRQVRLGMFLKGRGLGKLWHVLAMVGKSLMGRRSRHVIKEHTTVQGTLQLIVLPFEDPTTLETDRLARCPTAFAYVDPQTDEVRWVPVCAWPLHKKEKMREIATQYA